VAGDLTIGTGAALAPPGDVPIVDVDMTTWEFNQDPYPALEKWRELGPVVFSARHARYLVTSYRSCSRVLRDLSHFNSAQLSGFFEDHFGGLTMEALDTPRHDAMRGIWAEDFQREELQQVRPAVEEIVAAQVGPFAARVRDGDVVDGIADMARAIPTSVIAHMLGVEPEMYRQFARWSDAMGRNSEGLLDVTDRGAELRRRSQAGTAALNEYFAAVIADRRCSPDAREASDLVGKMVCHSAIADMTDREIVASNTQLVFAGTETTTKLMAATLVALAEHPDQRSAVVEDRSLIPGAVEEVHRWRTLTQSIPRHACAPDSTIDGVHIPQGAQVDLLTGAANRDPERWPNPAEFDIFRPAKQHLGFGFGMHICLGLNLTRLEVQIWLDRFLDELPEYRIVPPVDYGRNFPIRSPQVVNIAMA
jgi:cytochrome P450